MRDSSLGYIYSVLIEKMIRQIAWIKFNPKFNPNEMFR